MSRYNHPRNRRRPRNLCGRCGQHLPDCTCQPTWQDAADQAHQLVQQLTELKDTLTDDQRT